MSNDQLKPARSLSRSHGFAAEQPHRLDKPNIARDAGRGKVVYDVPIHGGMNTRSKSGVVAYGGDHKSALDSLSGQDVVPGKPGSAATAHPLTKPPVAKGYQPAKPVIGQRSRHGEVGPMKPGEAHANRGLAYDPHELGARIFDEACAVGTAADSVAHPYKR